MSTESEDGLPEKFVATLVRGECHYLRDIRFDHGIPTVIEAHHKEHLEEHAVDVVHAAGFDPEWDDPAAQIETRAKFTFTAYTGTLDVGRTVGASAVRDGVDEDAAARLRRFGEIEAARLAKIPATPTAAPKFDTDARRAEVEAPAPVETGGEPLSAPRARRPNFPRRA